MLNGFATPESTARYRSRFPELSQAGHFQLQLNVPKAGDLWISSIGLGTYLGEPTAEADVAYAQAARLALASGINLMDTAINYRHQRSERNIGAALRDIISAGELRRDEVVICTKAGYLSFDSEVPPNPGAYFRAEFVDKGILNPADLAGGMHCMSASYLSDQLERSRRNLDLETIDVFYVHNPETQLGEIPRERFRQRLREAFAMLEEAVKAGKIRYYGVATWNGFRVPPAARDAMSLAETVEIARQAGGEQHHFRFVQLPFSLGMPEAFAYRNQTWGKDSVSLLEAASRAGVMVVGSATLSQGQLTRNLPEFIEQRLGAGSDGANAIQFARSTPGLAVALVGMGRPEHVRENLEVAALPPTPREQWSKLFERE
ncbi:MAG TPA: aldo/keto reductase [Terriglobales bacterium]|nr:aldo/keto reductase [Terriglobales bacterium]